MSVDDAPSMTSSIIPLNTEQRRQIEELERKIIRASDADKMNDLINDYGELFDFIPTAKLNHLHKIDGHKFYKRASQTYFSKKSEGTKEAIARHECQIKEITDDVAQIKDVMNVFTKILQGHHMLEG
jgi:hypothetical protein